MMLVAAKWREFQATNPNGDDEASATALPYSPVKTGLRFSAKARAPSR